ncbi:SLBB domain-containing protein [Marinilongibacter aquaticus]|uniref:SLBB domain-containing protein n=1 Tax=Marinilongibacter aquaticus TaxID=2975157 RepID=UPI0021BD9FEC|nr:SLBB domain-containing protein [Marinilongibacter aquaticus]UBM57633.1 SLBB domain-containing protein [Marinilongibacter aquaticus]
MILRQLLPFIVLFSLTFSVLAQRPSTQKVDDLSDVQIEQFLKEAQKRGLSESEIETIALSQGYSAQDISKMRNRIQELKYGSVKEIKQDTVTARQQLGELAQRTVTEVEEEDEEVEKKKKVFGKELFKNEKLTFEPSLNIPTPEGYVLGAGDELRIDISGYAYQHYDAKVSPEGTIRLESLAPIYVNGLTIVEAKKQIVDRLKVLFGGLKNGSLTADVTLGNVRSIQVTVLGEAEVPGTYTLSSLSRMFNALYLCGGPTRKGSFRNVKLIRNNKEIGELDLYGFLTKGIADGNLMLQDQDMIFIPLANIQIEVEGQVKREGLFEMRSDETLADAILYAGGFADDAFKGAVNVERRTAREKRLISVEERDYDLQSLQNGDLISVSAILDRFENKVEVLGAVFRPGGYALGDNLKTLKQLIQRAEGLREDAFKDRAVLIRQDENLDPYTQSINLNKLLEGSAADIELRRNDKLIVKSVVELREIRKVEISGAVNIPGEYDFVEHTTVNDLILMAGGFTEGATTKRIEIARRVYKDETSSQTVEVLNFESTKNLTDESIELEPFDKVFIRELPNYEVQKTVKVVGEVNYPGEYSIERRNERVTDLIRKAGGLRDEAFLSGIRFYRDSSLIAIDLESVLKKGEGYGNIIVQDGDSLVVPKISGIVKVSGQVLSPTSVAYDPSFSFSDYIAQAGGYTDSAFVKRTFVRYANGLSNKTRTFLGVKNFPEVKEGMEIIVPEKKKHVWSTSERIAVVTALVSMVSLTATIVRLFN